jgi:hypothetical protein
MEDRILINGVWYIREEPRPEVEVTPVYSLVAEYNFGNFNWRAIKLYKDDEITLYSGVDIEFTETVAGSEVREYWDGQDWIRGVHEGDSDSIKVLMERVDKNTADHFRAFLKCLKDKGWF